MAIQDKDPIKRLEVALDVRQASVVEEAFQALAEALLCHFRLCLQEYLGADSREGSRDDVRDLWERMRQLRLQPVFERTVSDDPFAALFAARLTGQIDLARSVIRSFYSEEVRTLVRAYGKLLEMVMRAPKRPSTLCLLLHISPETIDAALEALKRVGLVRYPSGARIDPLYELTPMGSEALEDLADS